MTELILDILTIYVSERSEKICADLSDRIATRAYERRPFLLWLGPPLKNNITHDSRLLFYDLTLFFSQADFIKYSFKQFPVCNKCAAAYWIITTFDHYPYQLLNIHELFEYLICLHFVIKCYLIILEIML